MSISAPSSSRTSTHRRWFLLTAISRGLSPRDVLLLIIPGWAAHNKTDKVMTSSWHLMWWFLSVCTCQEHLQTGVLAEPRSLVNCQPAGFAGKHQVNFWTHYQCPHFAHISFTDCTEQRFLLSAKKSLWVDLAHSATTEPHLVQQESFIFTLSHRSTHTSTHLKTQIHIYRYVKYFYTQKYTHSSGSGAIWTTLPSDLRYATILFPDPVRNRLTVPSKVFLPTQRQEPRTRFSSKLNGTEMSPETNQGRAA